MPKVGKKQFKYTKKGVVKAKVYAKATGQKVQMNPKMAMAAAQSLGRDMVNQPYQTPTKVKRAMPAGLKKYLFQKKGKNGKGK